MNGVLARLLAIPVALFAIVLLAPTRGSLPVPPMRPGVPTRVPLPPGFVQPAAPPRPVSKPEDAYPRPVPPTPTRTPVPIPAVVPAPAVSRRTALDGAWPLDPGPHGVMRREDERRAKLVTMSDWEDASGEWRIDDERHPWVWVVLVTGDVSLERIGSGRGFVLVLLDAATGERVGGLAGLRPMPPFWDQLPDRDPTKHDEAPPA